MMHQADNTAQGNDANPREKTATVIVARRLDEAKSGNSVYLKAFLTYTSEMGYRNRLVFAPSRSFANLAWARIHSDFHPLVDEIKWPSTMRFGSLYVSTRPNVWFRLLRRVGFWAKNRLAGRKDDKPKSLLGYELDAWEDAALEQHVGDAPMTLAVAEYSAIAPVLRYAKAKSKAVLLHDLFSLRAETFKRAGKSPDHIDISIGDEAARCRHADTLFHASVSELDAMQKVIPSTTHIWMQPMVNVPMVGTPRPGPARAVFLGVRHGGNVAALTLLLEKIWPKVHQAAPTAELWIAGTIGNLVPEEMRASRGIKILGIVDDLTEIGGTQSIGLAPTALESGVSIKVLEYMALKMPTIVLPGALNGYGDTLDGTVVQTADVDEFVRELVTLLGNSDLRTRLAEEAFERLPKIITNAALKQYLQNVT
jgi:glycosyltransferase involved in cell wall biosynthesis